MMFVKVVMML